MPEPNAADPQTRYGISIAQRLLSREGLPRKVSASEFAEIKVLVSLLDWEQAHTLREHLTDRIMTLRGIT